MNPVGYNSTLKLHPQWHRSRASLLF